MSSTAHSYSCFGCVDFANNARTKQYVKWACAAGRFDGPKPPMNWVCFCPDDAANWTNPIDDNICWHDPLIPESDDFLGVIITDVRGIRSTTYSREVADSVTGGSVLGKPVRKGKQLVFEAMIVASTVGGFDYGLEWLRRLFEDDGRCPKPGSSCASCQGQVLTTRIHCPGDDDRLEVDKDRDRGLRMWPTAGTIDGINVVEDDFPMGRRNCFQLRRVTWTMCTETPDSYSPDPVTDCTLTEDNPGVFSQLGNCTPRAPEFPCCPICTSTCDPCSTDPGCDCLPPFTLEPINLRSTAPCFTDPICRQIGAMSLDCIPAGYEAALRFTLFAGYDNTNDPFSKFGLRNTVIRVYENPNNVALPTDDVSYQAFIGGYLPCAEIGVSWIPAGSDLVIDGISGNSWLKCNGKCIDHSDRVFEISGKLFPLLARCSSVVITIEWDNLNSQPLSGPGVIPSSARLETFLRHRT